MYSVHCTVYIIFSLHSVPTKELKLTGMYRLIVYTKPDSVCVSVCGCVRGCVYLRDVCDSTCLCVVYICVYVFV